ncbi:MAG: PD-(D/E)XK nuclease-like domain-containing protein [Magnetococcales bacterium]|nr:PD-(D/E)XK nuclease-like domain-containing protein [Magnetococcales bacterium]
MTDTLNGFVNLPEDAYHSRPEVSATWLKELCRSPAHLKYLMDNPPEQTQAMRFGSAVHALLLEPDRFATLYGCRPEVDARTKAGKEAIQAAESEGKTLLKVDEWQALSMIRASIEAHPAKILLSGNGRREQAIFWQDRETGIRCRCKPDYLGIHHVVDIKTTTDASPDGFRRVVENLKYMIQATHYLNGIEEITGERPRWFFLAIEKEPPYVCAVYEPDDEARCWGKKKVSRLLQEYASCLESGHWYGYGDNAMLMSISDWARRER